MGTIPRLAAGFVVLSLFCLPGQVNGMNRPRLSRRQAIAKATQAFETRYPGVAKGYVFDAKIRPDGVWDVYVHHDTPPTRLGGGAPEAQVRDRDGKVLKFYFAR